MIRVLRMSDVDLKGKRVLIREDLNVLVKDGVVTSDARIRASLPTIEAARKAGAIGGKLMGAGGGGFFMFYARPADKRRVYETMVQRGLRPLRFRFDLDGARIVANMHRS